MNVLKRCCFRSMEENKKRTIVTIIGVILATALITGVACLAVSFRVSMIEYEKLENGDYHYLFSGVKTENLKYFTNNSNIKRVGITREIGYCVLQGSQNPDKPYLYLRAINEEGIEAVSLQLVDGRMPENDSEIVIGRHIRYNGMVDMKVGDVLSLEICRRMSDGYDLTRRSPYLYEEESLVPLYKKTYTIVGVVERPNTEVENRMAPGYSVFTYMNPDTLIQDALGSSQPAGTVELYVSFTDRGLRQADKVISGILGVSEESFRRYMGGLYSTEDDRLQVEKIAQVTENYWLLKWINFTFSDNTMNWVYSMAAMAIAVIIVTSVFCIRNSFMISLTEKMKLYGRLASVGTTSKQQRKIIYYEAGFLGSVGIPLGIISGIFAIFILVRVVSGLMKDAMGIPLVFGVSWPAVIVAALLSAVTILLSASKAARLAAKLSPISAIRGNDMVKIGRGGLKCPGLIEKIFGVGGKIAHKNLKRAKVKYRTTVISIVVSVAVFIGLTTFMQLMGVATGAYYTDLQYQIEVHLSREGAYEGALRIASFEGIEAVDIMRSKAVWADAGTIPFTEEYKQYYSIEEEEPVQLITLGESGYAAFCKEIGVSVEQAKDKAIVAARFEENYFDEVQGKLMAYEGTIARYQRGDVIEASRSSKESMKGDGNAQGQATVGDGTEPIRIEVLTQTDKKPMSMSRTIYNCVTLIVSDQWFEQHGFAEEANEGYVTVAVRCGDAGAMEEMIRDELQARYRFSLSNYDSSYKSDRAIRLIISIFLYGFITVVALIGITNIFNTITTNMELRAPEFAMLRSVGMTGREFKRMIWLEGFFYGGKALLIGIPLGIILSIGFHRAFGRGIVTAFVMPWQGIVIASAAVVVLLLCIMRFSMGKINRRNIIDTIQNENI